MEPTATPFLCLLLVLCIGGVSAVRESARTFESFSPAIPLVHLRNLGSSLHYQPSITSDDSHLIALDLAEQVIGFPATYVVKNSYVSKHNNVRHVYLRQTANGEEIFNADLNINVKNKRALNVGHTFYNGSTTTQAGSISPIDAISFLAELLKLEAPRLVQLALQPGETYLEVEGVKGSVKPARLRTGYLQVDGGQKLEPVWDIELDMNLHWWNAHVSMVNGRVLSVFDWVNDVNAFDIYPIGVNDPDDGARQIVTDPAVSTSSPLGWNNQGEGIPTFTDTIGNNVYAQGNPSGGVSWLNNPRPNGGSALDFIFPINFTLAPGTYLNASTTNLFAWNNYIHDIFYLYGFTEDAGNFQEYNFGKGGLGNDAVQANSQDGLGYNNANFATPVDGQRPRMRMYVWDLSNPFRDGDLDVGIIVHEYAHGITNRLTGGPNNVNCLRNGEAGGMGEGWGDFFATVIRQRSTYNRDDTFAMGAYAANDPLGIRRYPYTTNMKIDPETYGFINGANYTGVHAKGEVWCGILWETYWNFVDQYGFSADLYIGEGGNNKILQNVVDGLKLQPCNPNFVDARDAIFLADQANFNGVNYCSLWRAFAKRGLGVNAVGGRTGSPTVKEDFTIPDGCQVTKSM